jgi:hypothetical protein
MDRLSDLLATGTAPGMLELNCNLLLTRRCGSRCNHCMFAAGPNLPSLYMSNSVLRQIKQAMQDIYERLVQEDRMYAEHDGVTYNMVGGEPTYDMQEFARCVQEIASWGGADRLEMTTNGSWLGSLEQTAAFARAVMPVADQIRIRVSDSPYHWQFRTHAEKHALGNLQHGLEGLNDLLDSLMSSGDDVTIECPECDATLSYGELADHADSGDCTATYNELEQLYTDTRDRLHSQMGVDMIYQVFSELFIDHRLYADKQSILGDHISPVGRARTTQIPAWQDGACGPDLHALRFTFAPDGSIYDFCCNGGKVAGGHARDGVQLLYNHLDFMTFLHKAYPSGRKWQGERCQNCHTIARQWKEQQLLQTA